MNELPVVVPSRGVLEVVTTSSSEAGLVAACGALNLGLATPDDLRASDRRAAHWPNSLNSRLVLARADGKVESVAEARTLHLMHSRGLPIPEPQVEVDNEHGRLVGRVDFLWRTHGVFLEFDGRIKYERFRRWGESLDAYVMREKRREELICRLTGWSAIRLTWADLADPVTTARHIEAFLARRTTPAA